jgi:ceramide glucosyltransferase
VELTRLALGVAGIWLAAAFVERALALAALAALVRTRGARAEVPGDVLLLRPLHGAPLGLEDCLESLWRSASIARARVRVMVALADPDDPAAAVVARVRARSPEVATELRAAPGPPGANRKVANLVQALGDERPELLVLSDADVCVPPDYVARVRAPFEDSRVGAATCPYRSVPVRALASRLDALVTNLHFLPATCLAVRFEGLHFGLGSTLAVRGAVLDAIGGLAPLLDERADDYALARRVEDAGWRLAWVPLLLDHRLEPEGARRAARRHVRWCRTTRGQRPRGYLGLVVAHGIVAALALALLGGGWAWCAPLAWWVATVAALAPSRRALGIGPLELLLLPLADLAAFAAWTGGLLGRAGHPAARPAGDDARATRAWDLARDRMAGPGVPSRRSP